MSSIFESTNHIGNTYFIINECFKRKDKNMANVYEQLLYTTLRIECKNNEGNVTGVGTGFLLSRPIGGDKYKLYLISNKHVLIGTPNIAISFTYKENGKPKHGQIKVFNIQEIDKIVKGHPNPDVDIAIMECTGLFIAKENELYYKCVDYSMLADFHESELSVAENVYFIGYPDGRYDSVNNLPLIRTGMISSHPLFDFNGLPQFIIDAQVFPGSSGSPVYIDLTFENFKNEQIVVGERKLKLLGIVAMTMIRNNLLQAIPTGTNFATQEVLGLGIVFKSTAIKELIDLMPINNR